MQYINSGENIISSLEIQANFCSIMHKFIQKHLRAVKLINYLSYPSITVLKYQSQITKKACKNPWLGNYFFEDPSCFLNMRCHLISYIYIYIYIYFIWFKVCLPHMHRQCMCVYHTHTHTHTHTTQLSRLYLCARWFGFSPKKTKGIPHTLLFVHLKL